MLFSSIYFTFLFLPIVILLYYFVHNRKAKNVILLLSSLLFYAYGEPKFIYIMLSLIVVNYIFVMAISYYPNKSKVFCIAAVLIDVTCLFLYKYLYFFAHILRDITGENLNVRYVSLPIGISFFTFQIISYVIDVYKKRVPVEKNLMNVALYISFFPQLIAGPIVR